MLHAKVSDNGWGNGQRYTYQQSFFVIQVESEAARYRRTVDSRGAIPAMPDLGITQQSRPG